MKTLRLVVSLLLALALVPLGPAFAGTGKQPESEWSAAGIIVKPKAGRDLTTLSVQGASVPGARIGRSGLYRVAAGREPGRTLAALRADPGVEWAEPDYIREVSLGYTSTPNDPDFRDETLMQSSTMRLAHARSWYLRGPGSINAADVWPYLAPAEVRQYGARASATAFPVAVIDTGFYMTHPDRGPYITAAKDCLDTYTHATGVTTVDDDVTPVSPNAPGNDVYQSSHGTCVAGEIAGGVDNGIGTAGAAYDTPVRVYKVQGVCVDGVPEGGIVPGEAVILDSAVIDAIYRATDDGCRVISMSLGGPDPSSALQQAIDHAHSNGVLVVAASGNYPTEPVQYPAACDHVIGVGSYWIESNEEDYTIFHRSSFTSYGTGLDLLAPGEGIWGFIKPDYDADGAYGTIARPGYTMWDGTSMATPLVAAGAAALWRLAPFLSNDEMADLLFSTAWDQGPSGYDTDYGWGMFSMSGPRYRLEDMYRELTAPTLVARPADAIAVTVADFSWQPVPGQSVTYRATLDGVARDASTTSVSYAGLTEGWHTVTITAMSPLNWWDAVRSSTTVDFLVDTVTPAAPELTVEDGVLAWTPTEPGLRENRLRIDGGAEVVLPGTTSTYPVDGLEPGLHVAEVRCVDPAGNESGWGRIEFILGAPPETPRLDGSYTTSDGSFALDWPDALGATAYHYVLDASPLVSVTGSSLGLSGLAVGRYQLAVRAVNASGVSGWASSTLIVDSSPVPATLVVTPVEGTAETGTDRIGTAIAVSRRAFPEKSSPYVVVATGYDWPDALSGSSLAGALGAPILLTRPDVLPDPVAAEIVRLGAQHVIVLGGTAAVSTDVTSDLEALGVSVERLSGATRYETARAATLRAVAELGPTHEKTALVVTGEAFPDALGGSALAVAKGWPIYLVHPDPARRSALIDDLRADGVESAIILGGVGAVPADVETALRAALADRVRRLGGATRYETAVEVARYGVAEAGLVWDDLAITVGESFPDALAAGVLQGRSGSVMLFVRPAELPDATRAELLLNRDRIYEVRFLGGTSVITPAVRSAVTSILAR